MFIVHTMPRHWVYLKMGLPDAYRVPSEEVINASPKDEGKVLQCCNAWLALASLPARNRLLRGLEHFSELLLSESLCDSEFFELVHTKSLF